MESRDNKNEEKNRNEKVWCEKFKEYIELKRGCKNPQGYCPYRDRCMLFISLKMEEV